MNNYAVLGLGMMGEAICFDILSHDPDSMVFGFELNHSRREYLEEKFLTYSARFSTSELNLDLFDSLENHELIDFIRDNEIKVVYGAIDYKFNEYLTRLCIKAGSSFLDLGGNPDIVESQYLHHSEAEVNKVTIVPDCGLAPGLANIIAAHGMDKFETLDSCTIR
ncbi:MAG: hypothetical protein OEZ01_09605, partial [Candidatus Heimdallarchaeota archaeon]|nr:hypothetical protein [Candidatus Heimdallarchaeota archaeon]